MTSLPLPENRNPTLSEVLELVQRSTSQNLRVCLPGRVEAYDGATQRADVQPLIDRPLYNPDGIDFAPLPVVPDVPVSFPGGGGVFAVSFPMRPGDSVWLMVADYSLSNWADGISGPPADPDAHTLAGAFAVPTTGHTPFGGNGDNLFIGSTGGAIEITSAGVIELGGSDDSVALASKVADAIQLISDAIAGAAVTPADGGATFKANIALGLVTLPVLLQQIAAATVKVKSP